MFQPLSPGGAPARATAAPWWWEREDLGYEDGRLRFAGEEVERLARAAGTPLYLYHAGRAGRNATRLREALAARGLDHRLFYAMKANRNVPLLTFLRLQGLCGVDVCSPGELSLARQVGFREEEISYTATSVSDAELDVLARHPRVWVNCDSLSAIRRLGERSPGREIGIRVNPGLGVGYRANPLLRYAGERVTKLGVYREDFGEALRLMKRYGLRCAGLHLHAGCGYLTPQIGAWEAVLEASLDFLDRAPGVRHVNVGGGLGIPLVADDEPLDLEAWSAALDRRLGGAGVKIWVEPGDYLVKDAGVLVLRVNTVERKRGVEFVGVDGGFALHPEPVFYRLPLEPVPCRLREGERRPVTIAGNINEALDVLAEGVELPPVEDGDFLAFLNAGGYGAAMSSNHCMRGTFTEQLLV